MYSQNLTTTSLATASNLERLGTDNLALLRSQLQKTATYLKVYLQVLLFLI
ncbi:hypothetical protein [Nostoc sp.]|uniref:hypothetical protein n=1 Tax=Nostoc sp. TaxID=1180 RepID=UPI002FF56922